ncbi:MAG: hypothetical protein EXR87_01340 [Gammaproteobacteria bacterium]|nr:hypothetical protein [Gammaproteobacteria bacterium]
MYKSALIAAFLSAILFATNSTPVVADPETSAESNIGFVIYTKSLSPGTLNARWMYSTKYRGPGIATGGPKTGFEGRYHVRYFYDSGEFSDEYDLLIEKTDDVYKVSWIVKGKVQATGVGMEVDNGLAVGWRRVTD